MINNQDSRQSRIPKKIAANPKGTRTKVLPLAAKSPRIKVLVVYSTKVEIQVPKVARKVAIWWKFGVEMVLNRLEKKAGNCLPFLLGLA